ncbi:MAG: diguanylate cyclase [Vicinamibacterales bacterium]
MSRPAAATTSAGEGLSDMPWAARFYVCVMIAAGFLCLCLALPRIDLSSPGWLAALLVIGLATATIHVPLPLAQGRSSMSVSHAVVVMAMLTSGPAAAVLLVVATTLVQSTVRTRLVSRPHRTLFNIGSLAVTVTLAAGTYSYFRVDHGSWLNTVGGPLACAELVYFLVNTVLVATAVALSTGQPLLRVWRSDFMWTSPGYFLGAMAAVTAYSLSPQNVYWWAAIALPLYLIIDSYRTYISRLKAGQEKAQQALEVQFGIVQALAAAIESKDRTSQSELHRFMVYAESLAKAVGLSEDEVHAVRTAALLHDIGNLAVPEHILAKPGQLTFDEFERVKIHTRVGAEILKAIPFQSPVAPLILGHHERWDGSGYPSGLKGDAIPKGARILAIADAFSALLSDRPHRTAMSYWEALATVKGCAGSWLDPALVERFVEVLPEAEARLQASATAAGLLLPASDANLNGDGAFQDIAVARHEARALFEIARALTSTQGVSEAVDAIVEKLADLIPIDHGALFIWDTNQARFSCRYATGPRRDALMGIDEPAFDRLQARVGEDVLSAFDAAPPAVMVARLEIGDRLLGALALVGADGGARRDYQRLLEHVAPQVGLVIHNAISFEETRQLSLTDPLTELPNRRYLVQHLGLELSRADRHGSPIALLLMDVNDFKEINDTQGHSAGDHVLKEIGRVVRSLLRPYDVCARFGGDEFVLVLWDCDMAQAERRRQQLEEMIARIGVAADDGSLVTTSVSIGIAVYPMDGHGTDQLLAAADSRMYERKAARRAMLGRGMSRVVELT